MAPTDLATRPRMRANEQLTEGDPRRKPQGRGPNTGAARTITDEQVEQVIVKTLEEAPANGDTHGSTRSMARTLEMSQTAISRVWRTFGLKPHPGRVAGQIRTSGSPTSSTPAARSCCTALSTVDRSTPAVRSSSTVVANPAAAASRAVARTQ
jgi:hypothetical protein